MPNRARRLSRSRRNVNGRPAKRESACKRGYDRRWRNTRAQKLQMDPLCEDCITIHDRSTQAVDVHHIKKIIDAPELRLAMDNLMSLCKPCHQIRTARGE